MNRKFRRLLSQFAVFTLAASMLFSVGCGKPDEKPSNGNIAVIVRSQGAQYWDFCKAGAMDGAEEMGFNATFDAPLTEADHQKQVELIQQAVKDKVDAIVISPLDTPDVADALSQADKAGIPVICINNDSTFAGRKTCIATNAPAGGAIAARQIATLLKGSGEIGVIQHTPDGSIDNGRYNGLVEQLESSGLLAKDLTDAERTAYEEDLNSNDEDKIQQAKIALSGGIKIVENAYCGADTDVACEQAKEMIKSHPNLKIIYTTNESASVGACKAIEELGMRDKVSVVGFDSSDEQLESLRTGILSGMIVQNPYNMGYLGIRYAKLVLNGDTVPTSIDTGVTYVTLSNIENKDVKLLLDPNSAI